MLTSTLVGLAAMLLASAVSSYPGDQLPAFEVPCFDYDTLSTGDTPTEVLNALKKDGIISITNVPSYSHVRRSYLKKAAACAVSAKEVNAEFLLHKRLKDGTSRYTISTQSGQKADAAATTTDAACPGYKEIYHEFSSLLEMVVSEVATTLDATSFTTKDGYGEIISSRKLITEAVRLDHLHVYQVSSIQERRLKSLSTHAKVFSSSETDEFALDLHEDDGMFIVFATPAFYKVNTNGSRRSFESVSASEDDSESGLIIQTSDGQLVRPVLKPNQVTLMVGTGYNRWVDASEQLPPVKHALRMPKVETTATQRLLRAWFGTMTLLPSHQRMLHQIDFGEHANMTAKYVYEGHKSNRQLLGCAPGRRLVASAEGSCTVKVCQVKSGATEPSDGCAVVCNRSHPNDSSQCTQSCQCSGTRSGTTCWMVCVEKC